MCVSLTLARIEQLSAGQILTLVAALSLQLAAAAVLSTRAILRSAQPLMTWYSGAGDPIEAWRVALRLPEITVRHNALYNLGLAPAGIFAGAEIADLDAGGITVVALGFVTLIVILCTGGLFTVQLAVRPIVRDIAPKLARPPGPADGISVRRKLLVVVSPMLLASAWIGVAFGLPAGADLGGALPEFVIALMFVAAIGMPLALLLAYSTVQPLTDLLHATERLGRGDYTTAVPELSSDEYGALARSFNDAMTGLADRQRLATVNEQLLEEVRGSRARIVAASDAERRRIERNIHDGAQQQLVALSMKLRMLEEQAADDAALRSGLAAAGLSAKEALEDVRELARGLYPSVLTTDGLAPALSYVASRAAGGRSQRLRRSVP